MKFEEGDLVVRRQGGPVMRVIDAQTNECIWVEKEAMSINPFLIVT